MLGQVCRIRLLPKQVINKQSQKTTASHVSTYVGGVGAVHEAVLEQERDAVGEKGVALHLTQADTAVPLAALHGLPRLGVHRARRSHLELVRHLQDGKVQHIPLG